MSFFNSFKILNREFWISIVTPGQRGKDRSLYRLQFSNQSNGYSVNLYLPILSVNLKVFRI